MLVSGRVSKNKTSHLVKIKINKNNSFEEQLFIYLGLKDFENILERDFKITNIKITAEAL